MWNKSLKRKRRSAVLARSRVAARSHDRATVGRPWHNGERRSGFTLVELLVVVTIIGILMAMVVPALGALIEYTRASAVMSEVFKLDTAMRAFDNKFRFPPDGTSTDDLKGVAKKCFTDRKEGAAKPPADLNPARAIVYWLGELSTDVTNPFGASVATDGPAAPRATYDFFSFATDRIRDGMYYPPYCDPKNDPPYIYFCSNTYREASYKFGNERIRPYHFGPHAPGARRRGLSYAAPETFQIIAAGRDHEFGRGGRLYSDNDSAGRRGQCCEL